MSQQSKNWKTDADGAAISGELHRALGVSHRQAKGLIDALCVTINGEMVKTHGQRLKMGDEVAVNFDSEATYRELPRPSKGSSASVNILWEDKHLVFLDKPAGLLSVPTEHSDDTSLADDLAEHYRQQGIKKPRIYIVHRLDRYTTGVMVFAKTPEALNGLRDLFQEHHINRIYKAILVGELPENSGSLHDKLFERARRLKMAVAAKRTGSAKPQGTRPAVTHYRVIERLPGHTVVELRLETGRRNQIRIQFSERGYPLLGDQIYGSTSPLLDRQALHAELLGLRHPVTDESVTVQSEMPEDMETALRKLRVRRRVDRAKAGIKGEEGIFKPRITNERKLDRIARARRFEPDEPRRKTASPRPRREESNEGRLRSTDAKYKTEAAPGDAYREPRQSKYGASSNKPRATRSNSEEPRRKTASPRPRREESNEGRPRSTDARYKTEAASGDAYREPRQSKYGASSNKPRATRSRSDEPRPKRRLESSVSTKKTERSRPARNGQGTAPQKSSLSTSGRTRPKSQTDSGTKRPSRTPKRKS
ncbi:MAG: RluA family pseudouridine synthase [Holophagales bacterium]|jgi:23S rRNA pseudouridine1911/1915/1917 synthase|nr:RluA family pseudouridine synthase [Holophagales bacterium]